ncbi:HalOD1 output domain-containing protein [Halalkalicoccus tibetensis]|uniref:HalOD1 output domain-containing protein n=1 Tax=Halalkalicoccus tibetensis TaxID=175632 RepID=A0ABD5V5Y3_9EURY
MTQAVAVPVACVPYEEDATLAVIDAVSAATDRSPAEIGPLNDVIDPDALNEVFGPTCDDRRRTGGWVRFPFEGFSVVVDGGRQEVRLYE